MKLGRRHFLVGAAAMMVSAAGVVRPPVARAEALTVGSGFLDLGEGFFGGRELVFFVDGNMYVGKFAHALIEYPIDLNRVYPMGADECLTS